MLATAAFVIKKSLIIHEENIREISTMSVILYLIKVCSKFFPDFYSLENVDLQNNYAIGRSFLKPFKKLATGVLSDLNQSAIASCFKSDKTQLLVF